MSCVTADTSVEVTQGLAGTLAQATKPVPEQAQASDQPQEGQDPTPGSLIPAPGIP